MLLGEYLFYVYEGASGALNVLIMQLVNAAVYYLIVLLLFFYAILTHIIMLAKEIDIDTVAEGVEQAKQIDVLKKLGVDVIQGYYFDKPLPKDEMTERLKKPYYGKMQSDMPEGD